MYTPKLRDDQVKSLYELKGEVKRPMTVLLQEAVDFYLDKEQNSGCSYIITLNPSLKEEIEAHIKNLRELNQESVREDDVRNFISEQLLTDLRNVNLADGGDSPLFVSNHFADKKIKKNLEYIKEQLDYAKKDVIDCPHCCKDSKWNCVPELEHADFHNGNALSELEKLL